MSIALLKTLITIADQGSFCGAAEAGNLARAAVGQRMKRLEQSLRITLFERSRKCESGDVKVPVISMDPAAIRDSFMCELQARNC